MRKLIAGSRGSKLALFQTNWVISNLGVDVELKKITTRGDKITDVALAKIEGKGFFTKEIDDALINKDIDLAVHSFKDLPTELPEGVIVAAVPLRESPRDALVGNYKDFDELPKDAKIGTSSLRRRAQVMRLRPDVQVLDLRGNLDTRVRKLSEGQYDAIIVAEAGLKRLGYEDFHPQDPTVFIPAVGQGALAITARENDSEVLEIISKLNHELTYTSCLSERAFLNAIEGGCQVPAGVYTTVNEDENKFNIVGFISSLDGKRFLTSEHSGPVENNLDLSTKLAHELLSSGGAEIIEDIRKEGI